MVERAELIDRFHGCEIYWLEHSEFGIHCPETASVSAWKAVLIEAQSSVAKIVARTDDGLERPVVSMRNFAALLACLDDQLASLTCIPGSLVDLWLRELRGVVAEIAEDASLDGLN